MYAGVPLRESGRPVTPKDDGPTRLTSLRRPLWGYPCVRIAPCCRLTPDLTANMGRPQRVELVGDEG
jgi:hypothetical protein